MYNGEGIEKGHCIVHTTNIIGYEVLSANSSGNVSFKAIIHVCKEYIVSLPSEKPRSSMNACNILPPILGGLKCRILNYMYSGTFLLPKPGRRWNDPWGYSPLFNLQWYVKSEVVSGLVLNQIQPLSVLLLYMDVGRRM